MKPSFFFLPAFLILGTLWLLSGCAGNGMQKQESSPPPDLVGSATTATKVKTRLLTDRRIEGLDIEVDTFDETVLLTGFVRSLEEKERAGLLASQVKGVREVQNRLEVRAE